MRVLHLCTSDVRGGAARGAYWLHRALSARGIDSRMLVGRKYSDDPNVSTPGGALAPITERIRDRLDALPLRRWRQRAREHVDVGIVAVLAADQHARIDALVTQCAVQPEGPAGGAAADVAGAEVQDPHRAPGSIGRRTAAGAGERGAAGLYAAG